MVRYYPSDWTHMLTGDLPPHVGPPVRLSGLGTAMAHAAAIDDEKVTGVFADAADRLTKAALEGGGR